MMQPNIAAVTVASNNRPCRARGRIHCEAARPTVSASQYSASIPSAAGRADAEPLAQEKREPAGQRPFVSQLEEQQQAQQHGARAAQLGKSLARREAYAEDGLSRERRLPIHPAEQRRDHRDPDLNRRRRIEIKRPRNQDRQRAASRPEQDARQVYRGRGIVAVHRRDGVKDRRVQQARRESHHRHARHAPPRRKRRRDERQVEECGSGQSARQRQRPAEAFAAQQSGRNPGRSNQARAQSVPRNTARRCRTAT